MGEHIKIIEDYLNEKKMQYGIAYACFKEYIAIENLLKRYKELKEEVETNYIPSSKIEELLVKRSF